MLDDETTTYGAKFPARVRDHAVHLHPPVTPYGHATMITVVSIGQPAVRD